MSKSIKELEGSIKYSFKNKDLLHKALTHKSFNSDNNNEKLEFLGDRVLGLIISKKLLEKYPDEKEGIIDKKFANLVNKKTCIRIARKLNLKKYGLIYFEINPLLFNELKKLIYQYNFKIKQRIDIFGKIRMLRLQRSL